MCHQNLARVDNFFLWLKFCAKHIEEEFALLLPLIQFSIPHKQSTLLPLKGGKQEEEYLPFFSIEPTTETEKIERKCEQDSCKDKIEIFVRSRLGKVSPQNRRSI